MKSANGQKSGTDAGFELTWKGLKVRVIGLPDPKKLIIVSVTVSVVVMFGIWRFTK